MWGPVQIKANNLPLQIYKIYTACTAEKIYKHLETNKLLTEEQKRCIKNSQGCKEQLIIDSVVLEQAHKYYQNLYTAYWLSQGFWLSAT